MKLSPHFTLDEFTVSQTATRLHINNTPPPAYVPCLIELCDALLEPIREHFGVVHISSGFRSRSLNAAIGGSNSSQHSKGEAADIIIYGKTPLEVCRWVEQSGLPFDQLIEEGGWTHISYSPKLRRQALTAHFETGMGATYTVGLREV